MSERVYRRPGPVIWPAFFIADALRRWHTSAVKPPKAKPRAEINRPTISLPEVPIGQWLSAKQVAAEFGVDEDTILRWWHGGLPTGRDIPREYHRRWGFFRHLFHPQIIEFIRQQQALLD